MQVEAHEVKPGSLIVLTAPVTDAPVTIEDVVQEILDAVPHSDFVILWVTDGGSVRVDPSVSSIRKFLRYSDSEMLDLTDGERALLDEIESRG